MREVFPEIDKGCRIRFEDEGPVLRIGCHFGQSADFVFDLGIVPPAVAVRGANAVRAFAEKAAEDLVAKERERLRRRDERERGFRREYLVDVSGSVMARAVVTVVRTKDRWGAPQERFRMDLLEPFAATCRFHLRPCCQGDAVQGLRSFDADGHLTEDEERRHRSMVFELHGREEARRGRPEPHPLLDELRRTPFPAKW